jgi:putative addiction module component (TIGR02574 family)
MRRTLTPGFMYRRGNTFNTDIKGSAMGSDLSSTINKLSLPERILLVEEIWDGIARENTDFDLNQSQKNELDRRFQFFAQHHTQGRSWEEIKSGYLQICQL